MPWCSASRPNSSPKVARTKCKGLPRKKPKWAAACCHSVNGCQLQAGDLLGSGTLSGPENGQFGSLLEITEGGKKPIELASGEVRKFLEDGDEIILRARCAREGFASIGFGECRGTVVAAR